MITFLPITISLKMIKVLSAKCMIGSAYNKYMITNYCLIK